MSTKHTDMHPDVLATLSAVRAPASLHRSIELLIAAEESRAATDKRRSLRWRPTLATAFVLAVAVAIAIAFPLAGGSGAPTVAQASAFALRPATSAAPPKNPLDRRELASSVDGVAYPYWGEGRQGWRTAGARRDRLGAHVVTTVFYAKGQAQRIGYSIVSGVALSTPAGRIFKWSGVRFHLLNVAGAPIVTWQREGHTCILAGASVGARTLLALAARET